MSEQSPPQSPLKIGFVGVGGMGQAAHLRHYATLDDCQVVAIAEPMKEKAQRVAAKYEVPNVYPDAASMLQAESLDGIVAIYPFVVHGQVLPPLLESGLPVMCEKPLANSVAHGQAILEAERSSGSGARFYFGYHKRSDPATRAAVDQINAWKQSGDVGPMQYVRMAMPPGDWVNNAFFDLIHTQEPFEPLQADALPADLTEEQRGRQEWQVNYFVHQYNLIRHLLGEDYEVVYGDTAEKIIVMRSVSGVTAVLETATYNTTYGWHETAMITFERGRIDLQLLAPAEIQNPGRVSVYTNAGMDGQSTQTELILPPMSAMRQQAQFFLDTVRGQQTPLCTAEEALKDLIEIERYRSIIEK